MGKNLLFIINPVSGKSQIKYEFLSIVNEFVKSGYDVTVHTTQSKDDAKNITKERAKDFDIIVCSGGDGTLNEVVSGLILSKTNKKLGYIPAGTTNDFASSIGISKDALNATKAIIKGSDFKCDIGQFNDLFFTYVAAFGLFTNVSYSTKQESKHILGQVAYFLEGVKCLADIKSYPLFITHDNGIISDDFIFGMISNSNSIGGFKKLHPKEAMLNDGLFEVLLVKKPAKFSDMSSVIFELLSLEPKSEYIYRFLTSSIEVLGDEKVNWTIDGECGGETFDAKIYNLKEIITLVL